MFTLEVCAGDYQSALNAARGGAARVELCSGLAEGGMTPSYGLVKQTLTIPGLKVNVLVRCRPGDFLYTPDEVAIMADDVAECAALGCNAVVIGALTAQGDPDIDACRRMLERRGECEVTFHRAFDLCRDPFEALERIIELGCSRVLTSGLAPAALQGVDMLAELQKAAAGRITILAGGGVNPGNAAEIVRRSGVHELHASARELVTSGMKFRRGDVSMGTPGTDEYARPCTSEATVRNIIQNVEIR